jgi:hypothetical protein
VASFSVADGEYQCLWASDVAFDGIRLEILDHSGAVFFDLSIPETGALAINTFSNDVPLEVVSAAVEFARRRG